MAVGKSLVEKIFRSSLKGMEFPLICTNPMIFNNSVSFSLILIKFIFSFPKKGKGTTYFVSLCLLCFICGQSYDSKFLSVYPQLSPTPLQLEEDLEQLKVLENGHKMKVNIVYPYSTVIKTSSI